MNTTRLTKLFEFLEEAPDDPFTIYAIAIEYQNHDPEKALSFFKKLLAEHEDYVGTYYHAANLFAAMGEKEQAEITFKKGLKIASEKGDHHAHRELQNAYNTFLYEDE